MNIRTYFRNALPLRRALVGLCVVALAFGGMTALPACGRKSGCPATESLRAPVDSKGNIKKAKGRTKSGLFPKDMERRMKKGSHKK
ncbi:MAG: hypothetical protein RMJ33_02340 [Saprospiraceae bacterium]|nr:hypothetical protein [Saprospiraceae bacterium]MDW8228654.1 hypothetical protein [Saprospiraceae bacterium]